MNTLVDAQQAAGTYTVTWNGDDSEGRQVSSGVYFYRISTDANYSATKKALFLK